MSGPNPNPEITHKVSLEEHNFIVATLNKNPLKADVMNVAQLIQRLNNTAQAAVNAENAKAPQPPGGKTPVAKAAAGGKR